MRIHTHFKNMQDSLACCTYIRIRAGSPVWLGSDNQGAGFVRSTDLFDETCRDAPKHDTRGLSNLTFGVLQ